MVKLISEYKKYTKDNNSIKIIYVIEVIFFIWALFVLLRPMYSCVMSQNNLILKKEEGVNHTLTKPIDVHSGSYYVKLHYNGASSEDTYSLCSEYNTYPVLATHTLWGLDKGEEITTELSFLSYLKVDGLYVDFTHSKGSELVVTGIEVIENRDFRYILMFSVVCISIILNLYLFWYHIANRDERMVSFGLIALTLFTSAPLIGFYITYGHDLEFHLNRIAAITQSVRNQFPVRIPGFWNHGYGYAASIFYNDLFLYFPVALRVIGFSLQTCYKMYVVIVNLATCCIAYYSFKRIGGSGRIAMVVTWLYVLSPYRISCLYTRASVGEYTAQAFYPLIFYGFYWIYKAETVSPERPLKEKIFTEFNTVLPMLLGVSGILSCHVLSCIMTAMFILVTCIVYYRQTFTFRCIKRLIVIALGTFVLNAWYIVPFLDFYRDKYMVSEVDNLGDFGAKGAYLWQLLTLFPNGDAKSYCLSVTDDYYHTNEMSYSLGLYFVLAIFLVIVVFIYGTDDFKYRRLMKFSTACAIVAALMVFYLFPWDFFQQLHGFFTILIENIQFPWRFLGLFSLFASISTLLLLIYVKTYLDRFFVPLSIVLLMMMLISSAYYMDTFMQRSELVDYRTEGELDSTYMGGMEYLPADTDPDIFDELFEVVYAGKGVEILSAVREKDKVIFECCNGNENSVADVSLLFYRHYHAFDMNTLDELSVSMNENKCISVAIPENYKGTVCVEFREPLSWRISEIVTLVCTLMILAMYGYTIRKRIFVFR